VKVFCLVGAAFNLECIDFLILVGVVSSDNGRPDQIWCKPSRQQQPVQAQAEVLWAKVQELVIMQLIFSQGQGAQMSGLQERLMKFERKQQQGV
jgi:hypothetical protein